MNENFAFPKVVPGTDINQNGLTKFEWFAGMALQGILANVDLKPYLQTIDNAGGPYKFKSEILLAFHAADKMINLLKTI